MEPINDVVITNQSTFLKGKDINKYKVLKYIFSKDQYHVFYKSEIQKKTKLKDFVVRTILKQLEKEKVIIKFKSYPVFWKRNI